MAEISTQAVIDAITKSLRDAYPRAVIDDDKVEQGLTPGAFTVNLVTADQQSMRGPRYRRAPLFDVIYLPEEGAAECVDVADRLCAVLSMVTTPGGDLLHGGGINWRVEDGVLHFLVEYRHFILRQEDKENMGALQIRGGGY